MNCVDDAVRIAEQLLDAGRSPWIGCVRDVVLLPDGREYHRALIPQKLLGSGSPTWTAHYVCCVDRRAYDPLLEEPIAIDDFAMTVFGRHIEIREVVSSALVAELRQRDELRSYVLSLGLK